MQVLLWDGNEVIGCCSGRTRAAENGEAEGRQRRHVVAQQGLNGCGRNSKAEWPLQRNGYVMLQDLPRVPYKGSKVSRMLVLLLVYFAVHGTRGGCATLCMFAPASVVAETCYFLFA
jgi:hypothetical protein